MVVHRRIAGLLVCAALAAGQQYQDGGMGDESFQDYANQDDGLYANYAQKQQEKEIGGKQGGGMPKLLLTGAASWILGGKIHSGRATKALQKKHKKEQKNLYTQYYNDVYKLQEANAELQYTAEYLKKELESTVNKHEEERVQRDYDEFTQPDVDGDDRISRAEFQMYIKDYLANYPGLEPKDYPRFEDFDHDNDGYINFAEYSKQMLLQAKQAETATHTAARKGDDATARKEAYRTQALAGLTGESQRVNNFDDLYEVYANTKAHQGGQLSF